MYSVVIIAIIIIIGVFRKKVIFKINQTRSKTIKIIIIIKFLIIKLKYDTEFRNFMGITKKMITLKTTSKQKIKNEVLYANSNYN